MNFKDRLTRQLQVRKQNLSYRTLSVSQGLIDFSSNDYLGFARSTELASIINAKSIAANGSTGSRLLSGNSAYIESVEERLAGIFNAERALIFNSGYNANLAVLSCLPQRGDTVIYDELAHACIKDGARLSPAKRFSFRHNDLHDLELKLKNADGNVFVAVESVYSMDGDFCPLQELISLTNAYNAHIILDEAHTTGLMGLNGSGLATELGVEKNILVRIYTFGKAMGIHGACVSCDALLADYLINFSRPFIYTTAPDPHSIISIDSAFSYLGSNPHFQESITQRVDFFNKLFEKQIGRIPNKISGSHPVQAIVIPGNETARAAAMHLQSSGYDVRPILSPTVKAGQERLRICLHTFNSDDDISGLIDSLAAVI